MAASDVLLPRFYTAFLSHFSSNYFLIPSTFNEHLPRSLPKTAVLMGAGGGIWKVAMTSKRDQVYFEHRWVKFVADNDIKDGDFLTFVFDGHKTYEVSIYGRGGCKETRAIIQVEEISDKTQSHCSIDSLDITAVISEEVEVVSTNMTKKSKKRNEKTIVNPEAYLDDPNNVYFETSLSNRKYELWIEADLVKENGLRFGESVVYMDGYGALTAKTSRWKDQRFCVKRWRSICNRNKLKIDDSIFYVSCSKLKTMWSTRSKFT